MFALSVIICTHNPRLDYLRRVLDALKAQTLPKEGWELLLVDNASKDPQSPVWDLCWHPHGQHVREDQLGLTPARLRGIKESTGEVLVFVDDDNVLRSDFLLNTVEISKEFPLLGAWGGGVEGEFDQQVPDWLSPHLQALAVRDVDRDYWSNYYADNRSMPFGAGLCVRRSVATAYERALISRPASKQLGRKGLSLVSGEDIDIALTAYDSGFGTGLFQRLRVTHIIPKTRMTVDYLCRLLEGIEYSTHLLRHQRNPHYAPTQDSKLIQWLKAYQVWRLPEPIRSIAKAEKRGLAKAMDEFTKS
ncbi:MAG: glycosyltransferase [Limisphaerales bacterium]